MLCRAINRKGVFVKNTHIFLVEDNKIISNMLIDFLCFDGHQVVLTAFDLKEALNLIASGQLRGKGVNLAIIDGNFPEKAGDVKDIFGGPMVAKAIKDANLGIQVIAHISPEGNDAKYGDVYVQKGNPKELFTAIASLP